MGTAGRGVEIRPGNLRVGFLWQGKWVKETLDLAPTPANITHATRLVARIREQISCGVFDYGATFPNSKRAPAGPKGKTFGDYCDSYIISIGRLEDATRSQYGLAIDFWKSKLGADTLASSITATQMDELVGGHPWPSAEMCNNSLIPLRAVFRKIAKATGGVSAMAEIKNTKRQKKVPDPLTLEERDKVVKTLFEHAPRGVALYFEFAFLTGLRPEELLALEDRDVHWDLEVLHVARAKTFKGRTKGTKTHAARDVDLVPRALEILRELRPPGGAPDRPVFTAPGSGKAWHDERTQRRLWHAALKACGVRGRKPYATRHTYATAALMAGVPPAYIARQLGHTTTAQLYKSYARWIDGADRGVQRARLAAALISPSFPHVEPENEKAPKDQGLMPSFSGRRDWTRTNDPHHVKVVL